MLIAVEGCAHGALDAIYEEIAKQETELKCKVNLLLCCGDFEAIRNIEDLAWVALSKEERNSGVGGPKKTRSLRDFHQYYSGEKVAPVLTVFIGGNHEASNYLQELFYGGWVAPNIYYLGQAGCICVNGLRIAGVSGTYKKHHYLAGHFELPPYSDDEKFSVFAYRAFHIYRLKLLAMALLENKTAVDIMLSHDWPDKIFKYGNVDELKRVKPNCREEIKKGSFSSPPLTMLLHTMQPRYWFSAHMHVSYKAIVDHSSLEKTQSISELPSSSEAPQSGSSPKENLIKKQNSMPLFRADVTSSEKLPQTNKPSYPKVETCAPAAHTTHFQALDKCVMNSHFLQLFDMDAVGGGKATSSKTAEEVPVIEHDPVWLAVLKATNKFLPLGAQPSQLMGVKFSPNYKMLLDGEWKLPNHDAVENELKELLELVEAARDAVEATMKDRMEILPSSFCRTAPAAGVTTKKRPAESPGVQANPQTTQLCELLRLTDPLLVIKSKKDDPSYTGSSYRGRGRGGRPFSKRGRYC